MLESEEDSTFLEIVSFFAISKAYMMMYWAIVFIDK